MWPVGTDQRTPEFQDHPALISPLAGAAGNASPNPAKAEVKQMALKVLPF